MGRGLSSSGWVVRVWSQSDGFPLQTVTFPSKITAWKTELDLRSALCNITLMVSINLKLGIKTLERESYSLIT